MQPAVRRWYLVHSPLLGPASWRGVAQVLASAGHVPLVAETTTTTTADSDHVTPWVKEILGPPPPADRLPVIVVGHSAACPRMPLAAAELLAAGWNVTAFILVDGRFPDGTAFTEHPRFGAMLDGMVRPDDYLPPWPRWWGSLVEGLVIDEAARLQVFSEARPTPRAWFDQACPVPDLPARIGRGYLSFGPGYAESADRAEAAGWLVRRLSGDHLHQVVAPETVAATLLAMADCLEARQEGAS